ncbi:steryl-sulfatase-like isoform X2 [Liolophura sinensis]|uniref:steryl-sulfatase-like isoform X2 n=1 Tax=Liolophura sinensis TaxID=3198878 RepID=UPI0031585618
MNIRWMVLSLCIGLYGVVFSSGLPNIVIFLADDLGIGDVGCFGNTTLPTPNIDRIASEGARLTHHLTSSSVCTPSRTSLLTGRYPIRSGLVTSHLLPVILFVASAAGLPNNETTFAELAKTQGYSTAVIGKWHLGMSCSTYQDFCHHPLNHGFDYFYGLPLTNLKDFGNSGESVVVSQMPATNMTLVMSFVLGLLSSAVLHRKGFISTKFTVLFLGLSTCLPLALYTAYKNITLLNSVMLKDFNVIEQPIRLDSLTRRFTQEGLEFIERQKRNQQPFLLFLSWTHVHTYLMTGSGFSGRSQHGRYGDAVMELDWGVGQILTALDKHGFTNNTMVYFTSDNGGHIEETEEDGSRVGGYNGIYKGGKTHGAVDGGIRVPTVVRYPGRIKPGRVVDEPTSLMDFLPTVANLMKAPVPSDRVLDGKDMMPLLTGEERLSRHEFLFHYCGKTIHAIRYRPRQVNFKGVTLPAA